ncbi:MAG: hypothetical protein A2249_00530 [Candidatus Jacksonbacteria bacterium RIFOXYA2_FULL_44_7]|uniref:Uncharacterized protein n=1 Tax=Candidatus Jacksonbacteria bacterium RIFCSPLOWO2_02_FULL_44_20 TaxID=1798460 RepID=A0A1G2A6J7_9BACT|nr:MAG: hypothetical protein A3C00_03320 [Candidatus Jacksonbacteria bacterium RIFCSPHIGHO2_02_FULL_44_25]OGY72371.1 MAG: hypothetical protein A3H61_03570 [Candidatus Jacksonbacteria bacterium RIFCSPLOWO2_02_FULL_44_20]OGY73739.1 MAG: hypothetical protein A3H07_02270 [Candidatus Jacksonbacteria bacterium RIFCSPLOWO2_12_FULL_44_15b]OGY74894.1 MAG: hypothetical protein A2249_00530 [Candidatus Jacksonbacteria bacterium RIFOXYA2_FULL_44_7]HCA67315.1 hypothetical protein [Candidatus Jacksonbacteria 
MVIFIKAAKEKLVPVLSERSEVTKRNPAFKQKHKIMAGKLSTAPISNFPIFARPIRQLEYE